MDKKTKKGIICVLGIILIIVATVTIIITKDKGNKQNNENDIIQNNGNVAAEDMNPINTTTSLTNILQTVKDNNTKELVAIEDSKANELMDLKEYVGLEKKVAQYISTEELTEIWLFKISKESQSLDLFRMFDDRIETLKRENKDKPQILSILEDSQNIIIKQQNGIVIMIISNDAKNIEKSVDANFIR